MTIHHLKYLRQCRTEKGFTLIETLVAIFITAIITTILYGSLFQIIDTKEKIDNELEILHEARMIFSRLSKDLRNAYPRGRVSGISTSYPYFYFKGEKDPINENSRLHLSSYTQNIAYFSQSPDLILNRQSDQSEVTYFLEKLDEQNQPYTDQRQLYALVRRENSWFGNEQGGTQYALSERVSRFRITYLEDKKIKNTALTLETEGITKWNAGNLADTGYPKAIEVELVLINNLGKDQSFNTTIFLPITK